MKRYRKLSGTSFKFIWHPNELSMLRIFQVTSLDISMKILGKAGFLFDSETKWSGEKASRAFLQCPNEFCTLETEINDFFKRLFDKL